MTNINPNETLRRLRDLTSLRTPVSEDTQFEIFELVRSLDRWLSQNNSLPNDWREACRWGCCTPCQDGENITDGERR